MMIHFHDRSRRRRRHVHNKSKQKVGSTMLSPYYGNEQRTPPSLSSNPEVRCKIAALTGRIFLSFRFSLNPLFRIFHVTKQPPTQTQMTEIMTQQTQNDTDSCLLSPMMAIESQSPVVVIQPLGRLLPSGGGGQLPVPLMPDRIYCIGRSPKSDIRILCDEKEVSVNQKKRRDWAFGLISNRHCTIRCCGVTGAVVVEDCSGNGTSITSQGSHKLLYKGDTHELQSGDEICLLNPTIVQRKIRGVELSDILQRHSYVFIGHHNNNNTHQHHLPQSANKNNSNNGFTSVRVRDMALSVQFPPPPDRLFPINARETTHDTTTLKTANHQPPIGPPGTINGDYIISDVVLGTGTVGEVRRGVHRLTGEAVAVKIMSRAQLDSEAKLLERLSHPYIIRLIHVYYEPHTVYLVMELMERDLFDLLVNHEEPQGRFSEDTCRYIMRRLLAALHYLHEHAQIVHRDLKPENILVKKSDGANTKYTFKLTDFGLAKEYDSHGKLRTFCGTPQYFAPEVLSRAHTILGVGRYGKPADLYSLGVILHVMLTGCTPQLSSHTQMILWDSNDDAHISPLAKALVENLLHPNPSVRLTVVAACDDAWINISNNDCDGDTHRHPLDDPLLPDFQRRTRPSSVVPTAGAAVGSVKLLTGPLRVASIESSMVVKPSSISAEPVFLPAAAAKFATLKSPELNSDTMKQEDSFSSPTDAWTLDQLSKRPAAAAAPPPTQSRTMKSTGSLPQHQDKNEERRPLSPCNTNARRTKSSPSETPPTVLQNNISFDTSSLLRLHNSITPGTPFEPKDLTDDEVVSNFNNQTESVGTFGSTDEDAEEKKAPSPSSKPRRVSEMQTNNLTKPPAPPLPVPHSKKRGRAVAAAQNAAAKTDHNKKVAVNQKTKAGTRTRTTATSPVAQKGSKGQKSVKSFFSPPGK
jgi:serine/threonine protein kinase